MFRRLLYVFCFVNVPLLIYGGQLTADKDLKKRRLNYSYTPHEPPRPFVPPPVPAYQPGTGLKYVKPWAPPKFRSDD